MGRRDAVLEDTVLLGRVLRAVESSPTAHRVQQQLRRLPVEQLALCPTLGVVDVEAYSSIEGHSWWSGSRTRVGEKYSAG